MVTSARRGGAGLIETLSGVDEDQVQEASDDRDGGWRGAVARMLGALLDVSARDVFDVSTTQRSLSLFRIAFYSVVTFEVWTIFRVRDFAVTSEVGRNVLVPLCIVGSVAAIAGLFTRASSVLVLVTFKLLQPDLYGWYEVDWVIEQFGLLFCFAPASTAWSLDALRHGVSRNERISPVFGGAVALVMTVIYFDSILTKLDAVIWRDGIAVWLATFVPYAAALRLPSWTQIGPLFKVFSYVTILYELLFPLVLVRPLRRAVVCVGLALHLGIAVLTPLRGFGLVMAAPLLLFIQRSDRADPPPARDDRHLVPVLRAVWHARLLPAMTVLYCLLVAATFVHMKSHGNARGELTRALGVSPTGVYADGKFQIPAPILRLEITTSHGMEPLPSFNEAGYPDVRDRMWKIYGFFLRMRPDPLANLEKYVGMYHERCDIEQCRVDVYAKDVSMPLVYDEHMIEVLRERPWTMSGSLTWRADREPWQTTWVDKDRASNFPA
jgi:hypothetical protein